MRFNKFLERTDFGIALLILLSGCGSDQNVVVGTVRVDGRPAEGVYIVLHKAGSPDGPDIASDRTEANGSFSLVVDVTGEVVFSAFWPRSKVTKDGDTIEGADQFGGRYRDARNPILKLDVHPGRNVVSPIDLTPIARDRTK